MIFYLNRSSDDYIEIHSNDRRKSRVSLRVSSVCCAVQPLHLPLYAFRMAPGAIGETYTPSDYRRIVWREHSGPELDA